MFQAEFTIYNHFHNILRPFDVLKSFFSPQVKRCAIITYKHGIYELSRELPNNLRPGAQSSCQNENFVNTSKKLLKNRN